MNPELQSYDEEPSLLAEHWFYTGMLNRALDLLDKASTDLARGATEQAGEHLKRASRANAILLVEAPSPHLTDNENRQWRLLRQLTMSIDAHGSISCLSFLNEDDQALFDYLSKKAYGQLD